MRKTFLFVMLIAASLSSRAQHTTLLQEMERLQEEYGVHFVYDSNLDVDIEYKALEHNDKQLLAYLRMLFGNTDIEFKKRGKNILLHQKKKKMHSQTVENASKSVELKEVTVEGQMFLPLETTQTGFAALTPKDLHSEFSLLSSPDLIKTLQRQSGVAGGVELLSQMHVNGGGADENLFLIDGIPLYQSTHGAGVLSAFNTDIIDSVSFYKSAFPARYSGRASSVTDIALREGNMNKLKGSFSIGLIDGRFMLEGPLAKDKTTFCIGLHRTWADLFLKSVNAISGLSGDYSTSYPNFDLYDFNAKVVHRFSPNSTLSGTFYAGGEGFGSKMKQDYHDVQSESNGVCRDKNYVFALNWKYAPTAKLSLETSAYLNAFRARKESYDNNSGNENEVSTLNDYSENHNSHLTDFGLKSNATWSVANNHTLHFGAHFINHAFSAKMNSDIHHIYEQSESSKHYSDSERISANEITLFAEEEWKMNDRLSADYGLSGSIYNVDSKTYGSLEPRLSLSWKFSDFAALKASATQMTQNMHKVSSTYLDLPNDFWVPSTQSFRPVRATQYTLGFYLQPAKNLSLSAEGFYKTSSNLLMCKNWMGYFPAANDWEDNMTTGKGRSYGFTLDADYRTERLRLKAAYTLSWSMRKFDELSADWFHDYADNRHKIYLEGRYAISKKVSAFAAWTYRSGNWMSLPTQYIDMISPSYNTGFERYSVYEAPNNYNLPSYHHLDVGFDFRSTTKKGHERIWNLSIYNVYGSKYTIEAYPLMSYDKGSTFIRCRKIPFILPSFSYTLKF